MTMYLVSVWAQDTVVISTNNNIVKDSVTSVSEHKPMPLTITPDTLSTKDKHAKALKNGLDTTGYKKIFAPDPNKAMWYGLICPRSGTDIQPQVLETAYRVWRVRSVCLRYQLERPSLSDVQTILPRYSRRQPEYEKL